MSSHRRTRAPSNDVVNKRQHLPNWRPTKLSDNKRNKSVAQNAARMARAYAHMHRRHSSSKLNARHFDIELRQPVVRYDHHSIFNIQRRTGSQKLLLSKIIHIVSIGICSLVFSNFPCFRCCITRASERANKLSARARPTKCKFASATIEHLASTTKRRKFAKQIETSVIAFPNWSS